MVGQETCSATLCIETNEYSPSLVQRCLSIVVLDELWNRGAGIVGIELEVNVVYDMPIFAP